MHMNTGEANAVSVADDGDDSGIDDLGFNSSLPDTGLELPLLPAARQIGERPRSPAHRVDAPPDPPPNIVA